MERIVTTLVAHHNSKTQEQKLTLFKMISF